MSTGSSARDTGSTGTNPEGAPPLAADRPHVDGTTASPQELRAEVARLREGEDERRDVEVLRAEVGDSVGALAARLDVKARLTGKKDEAVATAQHRVERARVAVTDGATAARERPGLLAGVAAALLLLVLVVVLRRRRS